MRVGLVCFAKPVRLRDGVRLLEVTSVWLLPTLIVATSVVLSVPIGLFLSRIADGRYRVPGFLSWLERRVDTGGQDWKQYAVSMLLFNLVMFVFGFVVLAFQPWLPLNPDGAKMLGPTTIFHTACSFLTNTDLQHYVGEVHLSYFRQVVVIGWNMFVSASVGFCCLAAITRALRSDPHMGNYYLDMWRVIAYVFVPASLVMGVILMADGVPMTLEKAAAATTLEPGAMGMAKTVVSNHRRSRAGQWRLSYRSSTWGPTAAGSSAPIRRIRSRIRAP